MNSVAATAITLAQSEVPECSATVFLEVPTEKYSVAQRPACWLAGLTVFPALFSQSILWAFGAGVGVLIMWFSTRPKQFASTLSVSNDGLARLAGQSGLAGPVNVLFAWHGLHRARLVFISASGGREECFFSRRRVGDDRWRTLCGWIAWLDRGQVSNKTQ